MSGSANSLQSLDDQITQAESLTSGSYTITLTGDIDYSTAIDAITLHPGVTLTIDGGGYTLDAGGATNGLEVLSGDRHHRRPHHQAIRRRRAARGPMAEAAARALAAACSSAAPRT